MDPRNDTSKGSRKAVTEKLKNTAAGAPGVDPIAPVTSGPVIAGAPAGSSLLPTAALPGANTAALPPIVDANRVDGSELAQVERDLVDAEVRTRTEQPGTGESLPAGVGETSLESGASMPMISAATEHAAALEAVAAVTLPAKRSPVFPAGADPAGAILEGYAGAVQSPAAVLPSRWDRARAATAEPRLDKDGGPIRIKAVREGFRRGGIAHSLAPVDYPAGYFSMDEIRALEVEPMLIVQRLHWDQTTF